MQEAVLTGESEAIEKAPTALAGEGVLALGDRVNMAFMGTSVAYGRGLPGAAPTTQVDTVLGEGLRGRDDAGVWDAAKREGRLLITRDVGLAGSIAIGSDQHPGLILVRSRDPGRLALRQRVGEVMAAGVVDQWSGAVVVVTEHKVRVRRSGT